MAHKIDKIDRAIVELLQEDGRMLSAEIARRIGFVTERTVRYRIQRLSEAGVLKVSAVLKPKALGYHVTADVWLEVEPGEVMNVSQKLMQFDEVNYVACSTGDRDISLQVVARDNIQLYTTVTETIAKLPGVKKATMVIVPLILKEIYDWQIPSSACEP